MVRVPVRYAFISLFLPLSVFSTLKCELYIAESSIPNAGIGIFSGVSKHKGDTIGNGDKAIPLIDIYINNDYFLDGRNNPTEDYIWDGKDLGMGLETFGVDGVSTFWPGIDAMVNSHLALDNVATAIPVYDEDGLHRWKHPGAGSVSPYNAGKSVVTRDIPIGGEIFKEYGDDWFTSRSSKLGNVPLFESYYEILDMLKVLSELVEKNDSIDLLPSTVYDEIIKEFKIIWDSRTLNAIYNFEWKEMQRAMDVYDMRTILQRDSTRSIEWLDVHGKCIDHIVHRRSTIDGAGSGAFAKRDLPKDTIVTGTPVLVFPSSIWFDQYYFQVCSNGDVAADPTDGPYGQQLLLNYCFGHPESTILLCPYGSGVNYINHSKARANVRIQWAQNGSITHQNESLHRPPSYTTKVALDYVTMRDISEGEELFLDYGDAWEENWKYHYENWISEPSFEDYVSATEFNRLYGKDPLLTVEEQDLDPYPENLSTRCHRLVCESMHAFTEDISEVLGWDSWAHENLGCACKILTRNGEDKLYVVEVMNEDNTTKEVSNVPQEAIKFADEPYTTDFHMVDAFRQPIGIPDDILPDAWRNVKHCPEDPSCETEQELGISDDPCSEYHDDYEVYSDDEEWHHEKIDAFAETTRQRLYRNKIRGM